MTSTKATLRKQALQDRKAFTDPEFEERNNSLIEQLSTFVTKENIQTIHTFLPIIENREPNITSLFEDWWSQGRKIMVSKTHMKSKKMSHWWLTHETKIESNSWGIPEPTNAQEANFNEVNLLVVPMLVGDKHGNRIGYGGGYYDKLLVDFRGQSVGLSILPLVAELETDLWDIPLNSILFS